MPRLPRSLVVFGFLILGAAGCAGTKPAVGTLAPDFALPATDGRTIRLSDFRGQKSVVLAFYPMAFTPGWTREMSALRDVAKRFADENAQVLGVSMDSLDKNKRFAESLHLTFPLLSDRGGEVAAAYGVKTLVVASRATFVIGQDGRIRAVLSGSESMDPSHALGACSAHPDSPAPVDNTL